VSIDLQRLVAEAIQSEVARRIDDAFSSFENGDEPTPTTEPEPVAPPASEPRTLPKGVRERKPGRYEALLYRSESDDGKQHGLGFFPSVDGAVARREAELAEIGRRRLQQRPTPIVEAKEQLKPMVQGLFKPADIAQPRVLSALSRTSYKTRQRIEEDTNLSRKCVGETLLALESDERIAWVEVVGPRGAYKVYRRASDERVARQAA
jgi:hypothetical protein